MKGFGRWWIPGFLLCVFVASCIPTLCPSALGKDEYPDCNWKCSAKNAAVENVWVETIGDSCVPGSPIVASVYLTFNNKSGSTLYALRCLGDFYVDGDLEVSIDECVGDASPGVTTLLLASVAIDCSSDIELRDVVVSWSPRDETCGDEPSCPGRATQCWSADVIDVIPEYLYVDFDFDSPVCLGEPIAFFSTTSGGEEPYAYSWDFGDGAGASSAENPTYTYAAPGTYTVSLTVVDDDGTTNTALHDDDVTEPPFAEASNAGPYCPGDTIELFAEGGLFYEWSGPDGFVSSDQNPIILNATASDAGTYTVTVYDNLDCQATASTQVVMDATAPMLVVPTDVTIECDDPRDPAGTGEATATDDVDPFPTIDYADALDLSSCGGSAGTITRTWTATDDCGNSVSKTQTITIVDTTPPSLSISSAQFECDGSGNTTDITAWLASAVATDTCSTVTVTNDYAGLSGACPDIGSVEVTFTATDACANAATRTATLAVVDTAAPNVVNDSAATDEDLAVLIDVLANDSDTCDPSPALASVGTPSVGTAGIVGGQVRYTPPPGYNGTTIFSYTIEDCSVNAASALVEVTVTPVNDPPVVNDQALTAQEDTPLPITVTATDPDGDPLTYSILSGPSNGTISGFDPATGGLTYTPEENYNGPDTFTFEACDPDGLCNTATVTITVEPVDDSPVADPQDLTTPEDTPLPITVTGSDVDGDPITYGIVSGPSNGTINGFDPATGQLTYTPDENYHGPDSFVFEACDPDPGHGCAQAAVAITVTPVNDPPVANDQSRVTPEDTATGFFALSVSDPDNTLAEIVCDCLIPPAHGTVVRGPNHTVNYTPNTDFAGIDTFTYEVCDSEGLCDTATVTITVSGANDNPVVSASDQTTPEDTPITFAVDHSDPDDDSLSCTASDPAHGSILPAAGTVSPPYPATEMLTYTPDTGFSGVDQVVITCEDGQGGSDSVTVEIIVIPVNDPPIANDESGTVQEDTPLPITVTATDPDGDTLAYMILSEPTNGTISGFDPDTGDLLYTPNANYHGPDSFTFEACDPSGACDTGVVTITVEPVDDLPVATPQDLTTPEDTPLAIGLIGSDADVGEPINFGIVSGPTNGTIRGFDADTGELIYTPNENYHGSDSFTFEVCDPHTWHGCAQATVTITITPVNDPPVAQDQSRTTSEDTETGFFSLLIADLDNTLAEIVCDCQVPPSHGTVVRGPDHTVNYIPNPGFSGQDTFSYEICDSVGACDTAFVTVDVLPVDDPPVARDDAVGVAEDGSVVIDVPANDSDPDGDLDATSVVVLTQPAHGDVTVDPVIGEITYDPDANFTGTDTFSYEICDSQGACDTATVTVEVNPVDDPPVANDDTASVAEDGTVTIDVPDNDSDPDGDLDVTTVSIVSQPSNGTVSVDPVTGEITYEPNDDFSGTDTFSYQICDSVNVCDTATVEVNVIPVDDPPVANDDSTSTPEDVAVVIDVPANDYDVDDNLDRTTVTITSQPSNGTVSVDPATGEATYTPETDFHGSETFGYQICDTDGLCDVAEVTVNVGPEDDPPVARDDTGTVFEDGVTTVDVVANDSDPDGNLDPTSVLVTLPPAHGDVTVDPVTGEITYAPDANYHGADSFNYQVCDSDGECGVATVRIDVVPVDDPPEANDDGASVAEDGSVVIDVVDNDSDPDGDLDATSVSVLTQPAHGTVTVDPVTGEITYEPDPNFNGTDTFDYRICDSLGVCDTAEVTVNVYPVDDLPVATPQDLTTPEDEALSIGLIGSDADGDPLTYNILSGPSNGTISGFDANSGELIYTPNEDYHGPDSFTFEVCDPHPNECGTAEVRITVTPVNDPPVAGDDTTQLAEDGTVTIDVPDNDSDPDGDLEITSVTIVSQPSSGTVTIDTATGEITYEPDANYNGTDTFSYEICDSVGACDTAFVTVDVLPVDDPPVARDDAASTQEDVPVQIFVTANDSDPDGEIDPSTVVIVVDPTHGTASVDLVTGVMTYEPAPNFDGSDTLVYQVCNTEGACDVAQVEILVTPENDPPQAACLETVVVDGRAIRIELQSSEPDGDAVTYRILQGPAHGSIVGFDEQEGSFVYVPQACQGEEVAIYVGDAPQPGLVHTEPGDPVSISIASGDPALTTIVVPPENGSANINQLTGSVVYTPNVGFEGADELVYVGCAGNEAGYIGPDSIVYEVTDPTGATDSCIVQIFVVAASGGGGAGECEQRVIISEVAWAGTNADPQHEWIELRNLEDGPVDLAGWTLRWRRKLAVADKQRLWKPIPLSGVVAPYEPDLGPEFRPNTDQPGTWWVFREAEWRDDFFLLERETDEAVLHVDADLIYEAELPPDRVTDLDDRGDVIELVDPTGCIVDTANADTSDRDGWIAGTLWPTATMERTAPQGEDADENWHTNLGLFTVGRDAQGEELLGTPRTSNSPVFEGALLDLDYRAKQVRRGDPIRVMLPVSATPVEEVPVVVTRPAVGGLRLVEPGDIEIQRKGGFLEVVIETESLLAGELHVWLRAGPGRVLFLPVEMTET